MGTKGNAASFVQGFMDAFNAERDRKQRKKESEQNMLINKQLMELRKQQAEFQKWQQEQVQEASEQEENTVRGLMAAYGNEVPGLAASQYGQYVSPDEMGSEQAFSPPDLKTAMALLEDWRRGKETEATVQTRTAQAEAAQAQAKASETSAQASLTRAKTADEQAAYAREQDRASTEAIFSMTKVFLPGLHNEVLANIKDINAIGPDTAKIIASSMFSEVNNNRLNVQQKIALLNGLQEIRREVGLKQAAIFADPMKANTKASRGAVEANFRIITEGVDESIKALTQQIEADQLAWQVRAQGQQGGNMANYNPFPTDAPAYGTGQQTSPGGFLSPSKPTGPQSPF